uniref:AIP/AIPL N-terminal FKBP-type PPIase domain-containing protein n=1 Tax=Chelonoidis abingdonii TaxID=106734 RepID=A0A8C0J2W8_CHEAB
MEKAVLSNVRGIKMRWVGESSWTTHFYKWIESKFCFRMVTFHFRTMKCSDDQMVIDDSKRAGRPMEIFIGNMFELEVWEIVLGSMRIRQTAQTITHLGLYLIASKTLCCFAKWKDPADWHRHNCDMANIRPYHRVAVKGFWLRILFLIQIFQFLQIPHEKFFIENSNFPLKLSFNGNFSTSPDRDLLNAL